MDQAFTQTAEEVTAFFGVDENVGLGEEQVKKNLEKYGPNGELWCWISLDRMIFHTDDSWPISQVTVRDGRRQCLV